MNKVLATSLVALTTAIAMQAHAQQAAAGGGQQQAAPSAKPLGLTQDAWNGRLRTRGESRVNPGYVRYIYNPANVFPVRTRESMITTIKLPDDQKVTQAFSGDDQGFQIGIPTGNSIAIKALYPGVDTNLVAYTEDGRVYTFYLRSEGYNSKTISDFLIDVVNPGANAVEGASMTSEAQVGRDASYPAEAAERVRDPYASLVPDRRAKYREYAEWSDFHPGTVVEDLGVYVPEKSAGGTIPYRVFRDDRFTYVDYGPNATQMTEWPTPLIVVQGVEGPVGFRTAGPGGRMLVMEALGDFVLRNGQRILVVKPRTEAVRDRTLIEYPVASSTRMAVPSDLPPGRPAALVYAPRTVVPTSGATTRSGEAPSSVVALPTTRKVDRERGGRTGARTTTDVRVTQIKAPPPAAPIRTAVVKSTSVTASPTIPPVGRTMDAASPASGVAMASALQPITNAEALSGYRLVTGTGTPAELQDRWKSYKVQYYSALNGKRMVVETTPEGVSAMAITPITTIAEGMRICNTLGADAASCTVKSMKNAR